MSSVVYLQFPRPVTFDEWRLFAQAQGFTRATNTCWYAGEVEMHVEPLPTSEIDVSTYWMGDLEAVASVVSRLIRQWHGTIAEYSPEFKPLLSTIVNPQGV